MTDAEFDAIALRAFPSPDSPSERVWRQVQVQGKWPWLPSPGESLMAACVATAIVGGYIGYQDGKVGYRSHLRIEAPNRINPVDAGYLAVSQISGIDFRPESDPTVRKSGPNAD